MLQKGRFPILVVMLLALPAALAGCLDRDSAPVDGAAADGPGAGGGGAANDTAVAKEGPAAPKEAFTVENAGSRDTIHPYVVEGQSARAAEHLVFEGEYKPEDCAAFGASWFLGDRQQFHEFTDKLTAGDAVLASFTLTFTNTDDAWADLHLFVSVPGQWQQHQESSAFERGEQVQTFDMQFAFPGNKDDFAGVGVQCYFAGNVQPIPYKIEAHLAFAEGVVPAGNPHLVRVSENVRELRVSGAPLEGSTEVTGHYRIFGPDDKLVGEFALNSDEAYDAVPVDAAGDYVIIVDHSDGGLLALGADAPPEDPTLVVLDTDWGFHLDYESESPGPLQTTITMEIPRVPLYIFPFVRASDNSVGAMKSVVLDLDGPRGRVWHIAMPGLVSVRADNLIWMGQGTPGEWQMEYDHHALAEGTHTLSISAEMFHGQVYHYYVSYLRPGESGVPAPTVTSGAASGERLADALPPFGGL